MRCSALWEETGGEGGVEEERCGGEEEGSGGEEWGGVTPITIAAALHTPSHIPAPPSVRKTLAKTVKEEM